jgi:magnesium transporter
LTWISSLRDRDYADSSYTGYYGANFENLPFLHSPYGVWIATGLMAGLAAALLYAFKKTGWF